MGASLSFFKQDDPVLVELHGDAFEIIISHMTVSDIFKNATSVSKLWRERAKSNTIWLPRYIAGLEADVEFQKTVHFTTGFWSTGPLSIDGNEALVKWRHNCRDRRTLEDYANGEIYQLFRELWQSLYHIWIDPSGRVLDCKSYKEKYVWIAIGEKDVTLRGTANIYVWIKYARLPARNMIALIDGVSYTDDRSNKILKNNREMIEISLKVNADGTIDVPNSVYFGKTNTILFVTSNIQTLRKYVYRLRKIENYSAEIVSVNDFEWPHSTDANNLIQCQLCSDAPAAYVDTRRLAAVCETCITLK
jgi:hypothetical protein